MTAVFTKFYHFILFRETTFWHSMAEKYFMILYYVRFIIAKSIRQTLDEGSFGCGILVDLQKVFDIVDHKILLHKLDYYRIRGVCNDWFKSYLSDRKQFVSINSNNSDLMPVNSGVPLWVLGPHLFSIYVNDLHKAIQYFADDTNLFHINKSVKNLNKLVKVQIKLHLMLKKLN